MSEKTSWTKHPAVKKLKSIGAMLGRILLTAGLVLVITGCIVACVLTVYIATNFSGESNLPDVDAINQNQTSIVMTYNKTTNQYEEYKRLQGINRVWVDYEDIPANLVNAVIAIEDERFNEHYGVDWKRTVLAVANLILHFNDTEFGGSTITQQLIKNLNDDNDKSIQRKVREILTAIEMEAVYTKPEILQAYLNILPLTGDIEGVGAGAQYYFAKDVQELSIAQCAALASITNNPGKYNPYTHPKELQRRQRTVLYKMHELGMITTDEYRQALGEELYFKQGFERTSVYDYYTDMLIDDVAASLVKTYGYTEAHAKTMVLYGGLTIYSCEDPILQKKAESIYANDENFPAIRESDEKQPQAAIYVLDYTGKCVAVVGGRGEKTANRILNRATGSIRQPGSAMKPIAVYAPAIQLNLINFSSQIPDCYITLRDGTKWPKNYGQSTPKDSGLTLVDYAIQSSKNTVPAQIMQTLTPQRAFNFVTGSLNLTSLVTSDKNGNTDIDYAPMCLGGLTQGVYPREIAASYQIFGNGGYYNEPYSFTKVVQNGEVILENGPSPVQVLDTDSAYVMNRLLQNVIQGDNGATAKSLKSSWENWELFAKTGTTQQNNDVWLVGGTPKYVAASWFGYDENQELTNKQTSAARNLWNKVMLELHKGDEPMNFDTYAGNTVERHFCTETGLLATDACPKTGVGVYKPAHLPEVCNKHTGNELVPQPETDPTTDPSADSATSSTSGESTSAATTASTAAAE